MDPWELRWRAAKHLNKPRQHSGHCWSVCLARQVSCRSSDRRFPYLYCRLVIAWPVTITQACRALASAGLRSFQKWRKAYVAEKVWDRENVEKGRMRIDEFVVHHVLTVQALTVQS